VRKYAEVTTNEPGQYKKELIAYELQTRKNEVMEEGW